MANNTATQQPSQSVVRRRPSNNVRNFNNGPDAYLNLKLIAADGSEITIPTGIPLNESTKLGRSLIGAQDAFAEANNGEQKVFNLTGTVRMAEPEDSTYDL